MHLNRRIASKVSCIRNFPTMKLLFSKLKIPFLQYINKLFHLPLSVPAYKWTFTDFISESFVKLPKITSDKIPSLICVFNHVKVFLLRVKLKLVLERRI